mgnify:CR=1 FL=1
MRELGLNQSDLARRMRVSRLYVTKVFYGDVTLSSHTAAKLAQSLGVNRVRSYEDRYWACGRLLRPIVSRT